MRKRNLISWAVGLSSAMVVTFILRSIGLPDFFTGWMACIAFIHLREVYLKGF